MASVRLLVGTRKGAFILTAEPSRRRWEIHGPHFGGMEVFHLEASPHNPDRLYASLWTGWHGAIIQRSDDGGQTWQAVGNKFAYADGNGTHLDLEGEQKPWQFKRVWHLEPALDAPDKVYAGVEDAAFFESADAGGAWEELTALRRHPTGATWQPGAGGLGLHTIVLDPANPQRMFVAISAAGVFRTSDRGQTWETANKGLRATYTPEPEPEAGYCVHKITMHPDRPDTLFMQKHGGVYRSDNAGTSWTTISGNLPSDFGFPIAVHAHEPETIYVIPMTSETQHYPPDGVLRVWRSRAGGPEWEPLGPGLPDRHCYVNVLREAMAVDRLDPSGIYFGTTGGQVYGSLGGDRWDAVATHLPAVLSVEAQVIQ